MEQYVATFHTHLAALRSCNALKKAGIAASRISAEGRGDTAQPFPGVEKNRVSICIAK